MRLRRKCSKVSALIACEFRAWLLIGVVVTSVTVVSVLLFAPLFNVREIRIRRQDPRIDVEEVQRALNPLFRERLLLVGKGHVLSLLEPHFPDIERMTMVKTYPSTLTITLFLEDIAATALVDENDPSLHSFSGALLGSGTYAYITKSGMFILSPIPLIGSAPLPALRLTDWGVRPVHRSSVLSADFLERILSARDTLRTDFGLSTKSITVYLRAQEFHMTTNKITVWFDLRSSLAVQFQRFRQFLKSLSLDAAKEYVDLRIEGKILYK